MSSKTPQVDQLRTVLQSKGGHHVLGAAKSAVSSLKSGVPQASTGDDEEQARRHALATFDAAFLMLSSDGVLTDLEVDELADLLTELTEGNSTDEDLGYLIETFAEALRQEGLDRRLSYLAEALDTQDARRVAFVAACGIAYLDGNLAIEEEELFGRLAEVLGILPAEANTLLEEIETALGVA
ncbi:MAG: tellurite resistance TerB family protein [Deltaproteobacteria bacterium]|nr:tellurite resistance TerB family protein [Deltaproteobacteria bacterium]